MNICVLIKYIQMKIFFQYIDYSSHFNIQIIASVNVRVYYINKHPYTLL